MTVRNRSAATRRSKAPNLFQRLMSPGFRVAAFELVPLEFESDELLLDQVIAGCERDSPVVPIFVGAAPGEVRNRIEQHFHSKPAQQHSKTAADELAEALAGLRRSLR